MALAAVVMRVANTNSATVAAYAIAPPICAGENVNRCPRAHTSNTGIAAILRPAAIAIGGQSIDLINTPPKLQSSAVITKRTGARKRCCIREKLIRLRSDPDWHQGYSATGT